MKRKFKIGDIVIANELSDKRYNITTKENGCKCRVVSLDGFIYRGVEGNIGVEVIECDREYSIGDLFDVDESCFDLVETRTLRVYLASPFFDDAEIERVSKVRDILREKGLDVFVPMEHQNKHLEFGSLEWREATFKNDVDHIDWCDVVVGVIAKGNYDDSGTAWELGYAYATKKPVILVNPTGETINLMIADSLHALIDSYEKLEAYDFEKLEEIKYENYVW